MRNHKKAKAVLKVADNKEERYEDRSTFLWVY